jgi:O-antigen/teichoic acid export membrane protein
MSALVGRIVLFVAVTSVLGRKLAPADFGFVALVSSIFAIALEFLDMGTTAVSTRQIAAQPACERATLEALLALRRFLAGVLFAGVLALAMMGRFSPDQRVALVAVAFGVFLLHLTAYQVVFQVHQAYRQAVVLGLATQLGFAVASVAALKLHAGGAVIVLLVVAFQIVQVVGGSWIGAGLLGYRLRPRWLDPGIGPLLSAGWMLGVAGVCYKLQTYAGVFYLWEMAAPEALASFNAAQRLLIPATEMAWMFVIPLIAAMSATAARHPADFRAQVDGFSKFLLSMSALVAVGVFFVAPLFLRLFYGDQYASGAWSSVAVFRWLAIGSLFALVTPVLVVGELAQGRTRALMYISIGALAMSLAGNAWAVPSYGATGAAVVLAATEALAFLTLLARSLARGETHLNLTWAVYLAPAALLGLCLSMLTGDPVAQLAVACVWAPVTLLAIIRLPDQKACRASLAVASAPRPPEGGPLVST